MNDQVFGVHCSNGFYEFDSHTTTNIQTKYDPYWIILMNKNNNMYEAIEHYKVYKQKQNELQQAKQLFEECGFQYKEKAKQEMDKFIKKLVTKNGTTKY